jgi:hypothetical protein
MTAETQAILQAMLARPAPRGGASIEQRLREIGDREEIRELVSRYAHRVAHGVSPADLFAKDSGFIVRRPGQPVAEMHGRATIERHFSSPARNPNPPLPMIHNNLIRIDGEEAIGLCSIELRGIEGGRSMIGSGYYEDRFCREDGLWKFALRDMTLIHWVPLQTGWAEQAAGA